MQATFRRPANSQNRADISDVCTIAVRFDDPRTRESVEVAADLVRVAVAINGGQPGCGDWARREPGAQLTDDVDRLQRDAVRHHPWPCSFDRGVDHSKGEANDHEAGCPTYPKLPDRASHTAN